MSLNHIVNPDIDMIVKSFDCEGDLTAKTMTLTNITVQNLDTDILNANVIDVSGKTDADFVDLSSGLRFPNDGNVILGLSQQDTILYNVNGPWNATYPVNIYFVRYGKMITYTIQTSVNEDSTGGSLNTIDIANPTEIPIQYRPNTDVLIPVQVRNTGTWDFGNCEIKADGSLRLWSDLNFSTFGLGTDTGFSAFSISFPLI